MPTPTIIKGLGIVLMAIVLWHTMAVWGLLLAASFAMIFIP
jgi:hypothetical protein